jgi:hAT family C-terminal dimerisation region
LLEIRGAADEWFKSVYESAVQLGDKSGTEPSIPRVCAKQTLRSNMPAKEPQLYYRSAVFVPLLDSIIHEFNERFSHMHQDIALASKLVPSVLVKSDKCSDKDLKTLAAAFPDMPSVRTFSSEYDRWRVKWLTEKDTGSKILSFADALSTADADLFPNIRTVLLVSATRPSSTASNERSFSALKRLKTYLRSSMLEKRLTGLALLHIHQDIPVPVDDIIDRFAKLGPHRLAYL